MLIAAGELANKYQAYPFRSLLNRYVFLYLLANAAFALIAFHLIPLLPEAINPYLEMSSFGVLFSAPHLMLGLALTLVCAPLYLQAVNGRRSRAQRLGRADRARLLSGDPSARRK